MNKSFQKRLEKWGSLAKEMKEELSKLGYIDAPYEILGENTFTFLPIRTISHINWTIFSFQKMSE